MIEIALIETNDEYVSKIDKYVKRFAQETKLECRLTRFHNGVDFISDYSPAYDVVFSEMELPEMDGIETAKRLRKMDANIPVIFMTKLMKTAIRGYEVDALDFMVKPVNYARFSQALKKTVAYLEKHGGHAMVLKLPDGIKKIQAKDVKYIEVMGHFLVYHTQEGSFQSRGSLSQVEEALALYKDKYNFIRCNSCFLVNLRYVKGFTPTSIEINGIELPISRRKKKAFMEELIQYFGKDFLTEK